MRKPTCLPVALTIAGSDSGGGAGIQADLKTFAALGVHGTSVITCLTAQNPDRVLGIEACSPKMLARQLQAIFEGFPPRAIKTGMLYSAATIRQTVRFLTRLRKKPPLIVDPVCIATSGAALLEPAALKALQQGLLPLADLVTPNIPEAQMLTGLTIQGPEEMRAAARFLHKKYRCAVLMKGGHLEDLQEAIDIYFDGKEELLLTAPRVKKGHSFHGTGCTYSAAIAACCAMGLPLPIAVQHAKAYITRAIVESVRVAGYPVLNHFGRIITAPPIPKGLCK